jgi:ATP-dependent RNA helicase RhlE
VQRILSALPPKRQTLLFSATMPAEVLKLTQEFLQTPDYVQVGRRGGPAQTISHAAQTVASGEKTQWLARWLREEATGPVLVFCRTKIGAERLAGRLSGLGIRAAALHADRTQQQRMAAVEGFRTGTYPVLVATDVAARGLDIEGIAHVVNYEVPDTPEAYVHRVGRTGRAEATGSALTLVAPEEVRALRALEKAVGVQLQSRPDGSGDGRSGGRPRCRVLARQRRKAAVERIRPFHVMPVAAAGRRRQGSVLHAS